MSGPAFDFGKIVAPGYTNADPPGETLFTFSAGGTGYADSIQRGGGEVTVGVDGGISLSVPDLATISIDANNDITLASGTGVINIVTEGDGNDVNIVNAGTIAFDLDGAGAITGIQTINGAAYVPGAGAYSGLATILGDSTNDTWYINVTAEVPGLTATSVVQATLQVPDGVTQNWIVYAEPLAPAGVNRYIKVVFASPVEASGVTVSWFVAALDVTPSEATAVGP
jgi:hypothetical protein